MNDPYQGKECDKPTHNYLDIIKFKYQIRRSQIKKNNASDLSIAQAIDSSSNGDMKERKIDEIDELKMILYRLTNQKNRD